jgi:hypothetical protein
MQKGNATVLRSGPINRTDGRTSLLLLYEYVLDGSYTIFVLFFLFLLWNNEAVVHVLVCSLTCGIPRPTRTQALRCGTPSLRLLF